MGEDDDEENSQAVEAEVKSEGGVGLLPLRN